MEPKEILALSQRILVKAAQQLGGVGALARFLDVGDATLGEWVSGRKVPPAEIILRATSVLVHEAAELRAAPVAQLARRKAVE